MSNMSKSAQIKTLVSMRDIVDGKISVFLCPVSRLFSSLRSDIRTDSLVDMIKKQQVKTNELSQLYKEQQQQEENE